MTGCSEVSRVRIDDPRLSEYFERDGVVWIEGALPEDFVVGAIGAIDTVMRDRSRQDAANADILNDASGLPRKLCYPLAKHDWFFLALADPVLGRIIETIAGPTRELVLTWEDIVLRPPGEHSGIPVHQDLALQSPSGFVASFGLHLHDARHCPVWFLPGSHRYGRLKVCEVRRLRQEFTFVPAYPSAGDIVVHNVHCAHFSDANRGASSRATWYLEFRDFLALQKYGPWPVTWAETRRALLFHAAAARSQDGLTAWWPTTYGERTEQFWLGKPLVRRVPHTGNGIEYDLQSPYYHFGDS